MTTAARARRTAHEPGTNHPDRWAILVVCCTGLFLLVSSLSSLNVALPSIQADTGATNSELQWIVDAYAVVFGGLLLTGGALGDRLGRRPSLLIGFGILLVGGLLGVVAGTVGVIIAARVVAGFGAALMMPATLSTLTEVFAPADQPTAIATWSGIAGAGGAFGPALGGWLLTVSDWNAVFAASAVIAAIGFVGTVWVVPNLPVAPSSPLDLLGAGLSTAAIGLGLAAIIAAPDHAGEWSTWALAASAAAAGVAFFRHQRRSAAPMLPLEVLAPPRVRAGLATLLLAAIGFAGVLFVGALLLQLGWGESALATGLLLVPIGAAELVSSATSPRLCDRLGTNRVITAGCALMAVGYIAMAATPVGGRLLFVLAGVIAGVGAGFVIPASVDRVVGGVEPELAGVTAGVNETAIELGASMGVAILGGVQRVVFDLRLPEGVPSASISEAFEAAPVEVVLDAYTGAGRAGLLAAAVAASFAVIFAARDVEGGHVEGGHVEGRHVEGRTD